MTIAQCSQCTWRYVARAGDDGPIRALHRHWRIAHARYAPIHAASAVGGSRLENPDQPTAQQHMGGAA